MGYRPRRALEPRSDRGLASSAVVMALIGAIMLAIGAPLSASASLGTGIGATMLGHRRQRDPDTSSVELGTVFVSAVDGWVTAIRYYKSRSNRGPHRGKLWSPDGKVLTSVAFSNESTSGWQTADLASPIRISGGKSYTVGYRAAIHAMQMTNGSSKRSHHQERPCSLRSVMGLHLRIRTSDSCLA